MSPLIFCQGPPRYRKDNKSTEPFFFSSRRRHTRSLRDWSSDVCSSDLARTVIAMTTDHGPAGRRAWLGLALLLLPTLVLAMDMGVLFFAVPFIATDLHPSGTQQLWIMDMYTFLLAGMLIPMGALGDRIGRRKLLIAGTAAFAGASLVAAWANGANQLIAARALLGVAGAVFGPSTLALIRNMFPDPKQRQGAIGAWSGVMMAGATL